MRMVSKELKRLKEDGLRRGELASAKQQLKGNLIIGLESTSARMGRLAVNPRTEATRKLLSCWIPLDADSARQQLAKPGSIAANAAAWIHEELDEEE